MPWPVHAGGGGIEVRLLLPHALRCRAEPSAPGLRLRVRTVGGWSRSSPRPWVRFELRTVGGWSRSSPRPWVRFELRTVGGWSRSSPR
ncbi:hypothetical protein ABT071_29425, partial [Streptomyces sp. NPDC002506]|uniref:hypothetical protein n=1 Tax=Streptomyces sp. NPDC002506 TaxID=3154536 RepID=UPI003327A6CC